MTDLSLHLQDPLEKTNTSSGRPTNGLKGLVLELIDPLLVEDADAEQTIQDRIVYLPSFPLQHFGGTDGKSPHSVVVVTFRKGVTIPSSLVGCIVSQLHLPEQHTIGDLQRQVKTMISQ